MRHALVIIALLVAAGCNTTAKEFALKTNDRLSTLASERDAAWADTLKAVCGEAANNIVARLGARLDTAEAKARAEIYELTEARIASLVDAQLTRLEATYKPIVEDLEAKLAKAIQEAATTGDRTDEYAHALQLATVLTRYGRESLEISNQIRDGLVKARTDALDKLTKDLAAARASVIPDAAALTKELADRIDAESKRFVDKVKPGYDELRRYITDCDKGGEFLAKGLLGESLGATVSDYISSKAAEYTGKLETAVISKIDAGSKKLGRDLDRAAVTVSDGR